MGDTGNNVNREVSKFGNDVNRETSNFGNAINYGLDSAFRSEGKDIFEAAQTVANDKSAAAAVVKDQNYRQDTLEDRDRKRAQQRAAIAVRKNNTMNLDGSTMLTTKDLSQPGKRLLGA